MRNRHGRCIAALIPLFVVGCGTSQPNASAGGAATQAAARVSSSTPAQGLQEFLEAVRTGNSEKATAMLTPLARQKTSQMNMVLPSQSATASFKIGDVEMVAEDGAHVACEWSDIDPQGEKFTDKVIWMLRKESEGWRVAGMATKAFDDLPPVILNFEDPTDMVRKQRMVEEEISRREELSKNQSVPGQDREAKAPQNTAPGGPR